MCFCMLHFAVHNQLLQPLIPAAVTAEIKDLFTHTIIAALKLERLIALINELIEKLFVN